jgi:membrane-associated phospholipid phosphatase
MKQIVTVFLFFIATATNGIAQKDSLSRDTSARGKLYYMQPRWQLPVAGAAIVLSSMAFKALDERARITPSEALALDANDINAFDRPTALMDPSNFQQNADRGDFFLNFSVASPALLALDKKIRKDWLDLLTLYLAAQAFDNMLYFTAILAVQRPRPLAYNPHLDSMGRSGVGMKKSFFSGHVSFSATGTFFLVKVYTDYHGIKGFKRVLLYSLAAVPPLVTGYYRVQAGRHFKTDVIMGLIAGGTSGILVPELFKRKDKKAVVFSPFYVPGGGGGMTVNVMLNNKTRKLKNFDFLNAN